MVFGLGGGARQPAAPAGAPSPQIEAATTEVSPAPRLLLVVMISHVLIESPNAFFSARHDH